MPLKVLVADDDTGIQNLISFVLEDEGIEVILASNGQEGVEQFRNHPDIDFIITDYMMPIMNGLEMVQEIRRNSDMVPILFVSTEGGKATTAMAKNGGANAWLVKPFDPDTLLQMVSQVAAVKASG